MHPVPGPLGAPAWACRTLTDIVARARRARTSILPRLATPKSVVVSTRGASARSLRGQVGGGLVMSAVLERRAMADWVKLLQSCRPVARHVSRTATPGEPGELRSCLQVAQDLSNSCSRSGAWPTSGHFRATVAGIGPFLSALANTWLNTNADLHRRMFD